MYQHLLVPIDGSPLAGDLVEQALALAKVHAAQVTFFHARADFAATGDGALMLAAAPESFVQTAAGNARALLAKAESAARAAGVPCSSVAAINDHTPEAILAAAHERGCDLIVMASHGRKGLKGMLTGSVVQKVLQQSSLPVLVTAVQSNITQSDAHKALSIVKDEHRSLAAVLHALQHVSARVAEGALQADTALMRAMLYYIEKFPERLHHPKEEAFLFSRLRQRTSECNALLDDLEAQHREGTGLFLELGKALSALEAGGDEAAQAFAHAVKRFAESQWSHMGAEEKVVLPAAVRYLTEADWAQIAQAFGENGDPRFDQETDQAFEKLFTRLLNVVPQWQAA